MTSFLATMKASFPKGMPLPEEFEKLFEWLEANDFVDEYDNHAVARIYLGQLAEGAPYGLEFGPVDPEFVTVFANSDDPAVIDRLAPFVNIAFRSSHIALWRDDAGEQKFVYIGSEADSWMLFTLTDNPVDALRFLAIGYAELRCPEDFALPPEEVYEKWREEGDPPYVPPLQFRTWVKETFGVEVPRTASEIVSRFTHLDDHDSDDPFWYWVWKQQGLREPSSLH